MNLLLALMLVLIKPPPEANNHRICREAHWALQNGASGVANFCFRIDQKKSWARFEVTILTVDGGFPMKPVKAMGWELKNYAAAEAEDGVHYRYWTEDGDPDHVEEMDIIVPKNGVRYADVWIHKGDFQMEIFVPNLEYQLSPSSVVPYVPF